MKPFNQIVGAIFLGLVSLSAQGQNQGQVITMGQPTFNGSGCSSQTARATLSPNGQQISILFDSFIAEAGTNLFSSEVDQKNCDMNIPIRVPNGYSIALFSIDYRGYADLPGNSRLRFSAEYSIAGKSSRRYSKEFLGPLADNYYFKNEIQSEMNVWSQCGAETLLRTQSNILVESRLNAGHAYASIDSIDVQSGIVFNIQYRKCNSNNPKPPIFPPPIAPPSADQSIHGNIDGFQKLTDGSYLLTGWACSKTINKSIDVHVYGNHAAGQGAFLKAGAANLDSEPAVARECNTNWNNHRFSIPFTAEEVLKYSGAPVFVHGISPVSLPNITIQNSGKIQFPKTQSQIIGLILGVGDNGSLGNRVHGFACQVGNTLPVDIEIFVGGPVGIGTFAGSQKANLAVDDFRLTRDCGTFQPTHGFVVELPAEFTRPRIGQKIYVYGIDPKTGNLFPLDGNGQFAIIPSFDGA